ncbi:MAG: AMP-binding protein [Actinobacteria bacterium]|nr:AMP-binding protein [Actinomycetota bacterium]
MDGEEWARWPYEKLAERTIRFARGLARAGVRPGDVVTVVARSSPDFVAALFGSMLAGAAASPVAPPLVFQDPATYETHVQGVLAVSQPALLVADEDLLPLLEPIVTSAAVRAVPIPAVLADGDTGAVAGAGDTALVQFTSGSSGRSRGVRVPHTALAANTAAIRKWIGFTTNDPLGSWLPIHHDMGLVGCLVTPMTAGTDIWLLQPEQFIHTPLRFVRIFGEHAGAVTAMPNFGLEYIVRKVKPEWLEGMDFSAWRAVIIGAERLNPESFARFQRLLTPHGLKPNAMRSGYGLAEATLAATGLPLEEVWSKVVIDPDSIAMGQPVRLQPAGVGVGMVGSGRPLSGFHITVVDDDGRQLPEQTVGEIQVEGPSVAAGYTTTSPSASLTSFADGVLRTGDAGFVVDGQLYVLGRMGDSMKVRGRAVFAEDVEAVVVAEGVPAGRVAAALGAVGEEPTVVMVFEEARPEQLESAERAVRRHASGARVVIVNGPRGTISFTSSGKPKRRLLWSAFLDGTLTESTAATSVANI